MSNLRRVTRNELDVQKWEALVDQLDGYSYSSSVAFLDLFPVQIDFLIHGDYQGGMILPVKKKWGVSILFTPFFIPFSAWLGSPIAYQVVEKFLQNEFEELSFLGRFPADLPHEKCVYQVLDPTKEYGSQAKRALKKAEKEGYALAENVDLEEAVFFVVDELLAKDSKLSVEDGLFLQELVKGLQKQGRLRTLALTKMGELVACQFFIEQGKNSYYLKGAANEQGMKNGAMYFLMDQKIQHCKKQGGQLDFGGSNKDGIRNFYLNLGGVDQSYYRMFWTRAPYYYRFAKAFRKLFVRN